MILRTLNLFQKMRRTWQMAIILSCTWISLMSFFYAYTIIKYPSNITKIGSFITGKHSFYQSFEWQKIKPKLTRIDPKTIDLSLYKPVGSRWTIEDSDTEEDDYANKSPHFKLCGFIKLIFLPLFVLWFLALLITFIILPKQKEIFITGKNFFQSLHAGMQMYLILSSFIIVYALLSHGFWTAGPILILFAAPFIVQQCLYAAVYTIVKAIKDAQK